MQLRISAVCRWDGALGAASILYWIVSTPFRAAFAKAMAALAAYRRKKA
jgi:hypothetical protein